MNELSENPVQAVNAAPAPRPANARATGTAALNLVNTADVPAEFRILQGSTQVARVGVSPGARATVPMGHGYVVQATTTLGDCTLTSSPLRFEAGSAHLLAQMKMQQPGLYDFNIVQLPATQLRAIVLENTWREPVVFKITRDGSPFAATLVVDEHDDGTVSTLEQWDIYAIINGITTQPVRTDDPRATLSASQDTNEDGYTLKVS